MAGFIQNILWNSVEGFVEAGTRTAGEYAGNALIKAGDMIENGGRSVGNGIERRAMAYGSSISGQTSQPLPKALPSTTRKPAIKRSNSLPASSKPVTGASSRTPLGANKDPGKNQVSGATGAAKKPATGAVNRAKSTAEGTQRSIPPFKGPTSTGAASKTLPKPYPNTNNLSKPYGANTFPSSEKKTAVRPSQPKPFVAPAEKKVDEKKPYPGTNTLPGQGSRTPVRQGQMKPLPRLGPQVKEGQKMQHIVV